MAFGPRRGLLVNRRAFAIGDLFLGEEAGAWYDPSDLSTLFQDAAGTTPVTTDSDPVGLMRDISGNGNDLTQATAGKRPLYKTSLAGIRRQRRFPACDIHDCTAMGARSSVPAEQLDVWSPHFLGRGCQ